MCILFFHDSKHSWKAFSGIFFSSVVEAFLMESMSSLRNRFDLGEEEKVTWGQIGGIWGVFQSVHALASQRLMKARRLKSKVKVMLIVFFNIQGIVHFEFLPQGQTVNQTVYKEILRHFVRSVRDKRWSLWEANAWALHHNNAPAYTALSICQFLAERNIATLEHPPYSPNLAPRDFFLFPKIKSVLKGTHFSDIDSIKKAVTTELKNIPENAFQECFESWKKRMHKCL